MAALEAEDVTEPHPDVHELFQYYNQLYFQGSLESVAVRWSTKRMTLCAGLCKYVTGGFCEIVLSEPLLKYRTSKELKETLLHEMIHAWQKPQFVTRKNRDREDHGPIFCSKMTEINKSRSSISIADAFRPARGYHITVYHSFHDEVDVYRQHWWKCLKCGELVKRAMNRQPSEKDCFMYSKGGCGSSQRQCLWHKHLRFCGGSFEKVKEPEGYGEKRKRKQRPKEQGGINPPKDAAKRSKETIDSFLRKDESGKEECERVEMRERALGAALTRQKTNIGSGASSAVDNTRRALTSKESPPNQIERPEVIIVDSPNSKQAQQRDNEVGECPICGTILDVSDALTVNSHVDSCLAI